MEFCFTPIGDKNANLEIAQISFRLDWSASVTSLLVRSEEIQTTISKSQVNGLRRLYRCLDDAANDTQIAC